MDINKVVTLLTYYVVFLPAFWHVLLMVPETGHLDWNIFILNFPLFTFYCDLNYFCYLPDILGNGKNW